MCRAAGWLVPVGRLGPVSPVLIAMCGLGFSGKSVLARSLSRELGIRVLCYDTEIYPAHRHLVPPGSSAAAEYDFVQDIAREQIGAILAAGESLIYDDLLLERDDRRKLAAIARDHRAELVLVYLDTPLAAINQRRAENTRSRARTEMSEAKLRLDASLLEPPGPAERAIYVRPADTVAEVAAKIQARLPPGTRRSRKASPGSAAFLSVGIGRTSITALEWLSPGPILQACRSTSIADYGHGSSFGSSRVPPDSRDALAAASHAASRAEHGSAPVARRSATFQWRR